MTLSPGQQSCLLDLAREVIRGSLGKREVTLPPTDDPALAVHAGAFVTLHTRASHQLRGCIGQIRGTGPLKDSVKEMAQAVLEDPRFYRDPVTLDELPDLELEITVLSPLELAANPLDFDLLQHGIYMVCGGVSGCFLPQVARETGWTKEQLLSRLASEKMDLDDDAWKRPDARLYRYTTLIIGPEPFVK